MNDTIL